MILTVTPNPLLEKRLHFNEVNLGNVNRSSEETYYAGGKGINVSRQLNKLQIKNSALTFLGGSNGKILRKTLIDEGIDFNSVNIKDETRYSSVIIEKKNRRMTSFFAPDNEITETEVSHFIDKLDKAIQNCSIVVFSGSSPCKAADEIFIKGIGLAKQYDKISIVDTYGSHLKDCLDLAPFCIHNNLNELENSLNISLKIEDEIKSFLDELYSKGIKHSYLTNGSSPLYCSKFGFHYKVIPPQINAVDSIGSGDAFTAGVAYGMEKDLVFDEALKTAAALGAVNASRFDAANVSFEEIENILEQIKITPLGKKMKLIDDSPNYQ